MIRYSKQKIFYVTDGHPAQQKKIAGVAGGKQTSNRGVFIPPYSPELNAQEYLNQDVKTNVIGKSALSIKLKCAPTLKVL
ncbi:MAG: hypothetical protein IPH58_19635 [Sphingobacteriales bacterium]|nr:hypothetical protein [Sphingobacteriales bacterium]